ncbi:MAG TPA: hypothetical protein VGA78_15615 [Gemmatimonadales bacterium]
MLRLAALALLACVLPAPTSAQVSVVGARDLQFGFVALGVPTVVLPTDAVKSGQWTLTAPVGTRIQIRLTPPNQLLGPAGATMPVNFQNGDVFVQGTWSGALQEFFNPNATKNFRFTGGTQAILRLGGQVTPAGNQSTGPYANTVVCTINVN